MVYFPLKSVLDVVSDNYINPFQIWCQQSVSEEICQRERLKFSYKYFSTKGVIRKSLAIKLDLSADLLVYPSHDGTVPRRFSLSYLAEDAYLHALES